MQCNNIIKIKCKQNDVEITPIKIKDLNNNN